MTSQHLNIVCLTLLALLERGRCQAPGVIGTSGGNGAAKNCVFPFIYKGVTFTNCITADYKDIPWCAVTGNYDIDRQWGNCILTLSATRTKEGNANGAGCAFPFIYRNVQYFTCITVDHNTAKPWCATTGNYDIDRQWGNCVFYVAVGTKGGNSDNANCQFPFHYQGQSISGCIQDNVRGSWCSTTANFDSDGQYGECALTYAGCSNTYQTVQNQLSYGGIGQTGATSLSACQRICDSDSRCVGFDYDNNGGLALRCFLHLEANQFNNHISASLVSQYILTNRCNEGVVTFGGNSGVNGARCFFPYIYRGRVYTSCNSNNWYGPWCATTSNYDADKRWGECANIAIA